MKLVIVESPAKCETIKRYLGNDYEVMASLGHIRDLATSGKGGLGVDIDGGFLPTYVISKSKLETVNNLKNKARKAKEVILATDPDREGEAIAWHLAVVLGLDIKKTKRLEFHEITRDSITKAMQNPRLIDENLVASQETRRILDRIIGFNLSSLLNRKIKSRSAGRVQSATLKLIVDHDKEVDGFVSEEYWNILAKTKIGNREVNLTFVGLNNKAVELHSEKEAHEILSRLPDSLKIVSIDKEIRIKESKEPFRTSTLQQEAFAKLKFRTRDTQRVAQTLYEGLTVGGEHIGLITYMRTDATRLSPIFVESASKYILDNYGNDYLGHLKKSKNMELVQDAHEAIRPTRISLTPDSVAGCLTKQQYELYKLIYNRALASLMKPKKEEVVTINLEGNGLTFKIVFSKTLFAGYEVILKDKEEAGIYRTFIPEFKIGEEIAVISKTCEQKFTQPPSYYSEAKIVKVMEEVGIGRPSTYASTIELLKKREYVNDEKGVLESTEQGKKTTRVLEKYFADIVDAEYTAHMEAKLDTVQTGTQSRVETLSDFYSNFVKELDYARDNMYKDEALPTGETCPICGSPLVYKRGRNGDFIGCSSYPTCTYIKKQKEEVIYTGEICPKCGSPLVEKTEKKKHHKFVACSNYPKCDYVKPMKVEENPIGRNCPKCGAPLLKKKGPYGYFIGCSNYPQCNYMEKIYKKRRK